MPRVSLKHIPLQTERASTLPSLAHWIVFGLFTLHLVLVLLRVFGNARWAEGLLLVLATATTLASLNRQLPGQNVMLAALIIAGIGSAAHLLNAVTGVPFGPIAYTSRFGQKLAGPLPWPVPMLWIVILLNCRGVARLILRPYRTTRNYGFVVIGLTIGLTVCLVLLLEAYAIEAGQFWTWQETKTSFRWHTAPWVNFLGWSVISLLILAFVTPVLLNKKPVKFPPDYHPLIMWFLLHAALAVPFVTHQMQLALIFCVVSAILPGSLALVGAWRARRKA